MYYVYEKKQITPKQHAAITLIACLVVIIATCVVISKANNTHIKKLETQIAMYNQQAESYEQKIDYYEGIKKEYDSLKPKIEVLDNYQTTIQQNETKIKQLTTQKEELSKQNANFENTLKKWAAIGTKPQNYRIAGDVSRGGDRITKKRYVGKWLGTYYAPNAKECGNNKGITKSGNPITPGKTIAVDPKYWKLGTRFYIEGIGEVIAEDTGNAIKGKNRFDFAVFSSDISHSGNFYADVYIIEE